MDMAGAAKEKTKEGKIKEETGLPEDEGPAPIYTRACDLCLRSL